MNEKQEHDIMVEQLEKVFVPLSTENFLTDNMKGFLKEKYPSYYKAIINEIEEAVRNYGAVIADLLVNLHYPKNSSVEEEEKFMWSFVDTGKIHIRNLMLRIHAEPKN